MDLRKIRKLIELIQETGIAEIEIREGEESVRISRETSHANSPTMVNLPANYAPPPVQINAPAPVPANVQEQPPVANANANKHTVKAPMVGTVYLCPSPG